MSRDQDTQKNEEPTPYKLQEARKKGSVARSVEVVTVSVIALMVVMLYTFAKTAIDGLAKLIARSIRIAPSLLDSAPHSMAVIAQQIMTAVQLMAPLFAALVLVIVAANLLQSGVVFSTEPLKPNFERLNPVAGFKRFFSIRLLYELIKSLIKLAALAAVAGFALSDLLTQTQKMAAQAPRGFLYQFLPLAAGLVAKLLAVMVFFAIVDRLFSNWDFLRSMRMSRRELEDEHKHREGDPRIRSRLRALRNEFLKRTQGVSRVPDADVLITNPTHVAVALRYVVGSSPAPQVLAKGAGGLAKRMREAANLAGVPVVHSPVLARALFKEVQADQYIPERWYPQVAKILVWLEAAKRARVAALQSTDLAPVRGVSA